MKDMANDFVDDVMNEIDAKPPRIRLILKWVIRASIVLIAGSFVFGQMKMGELNRLDNIEEKLNENNKASVELRRDMEIGFNDVNERFDNVDDRIIKIYDDGIDLFYQYQEHNAKQLELIINHGAENKDLLSKMIEINNSKQKLNFESQIIKAKNYNSDDVGGFKNSIVIVNPETKDTTFYVTGATVDFIDDFNTDEYQIIVVSRNLDNDGLYDIEYKRK